MNPFISLPITVLLVLRLLSRKSFTPLGILCGAATALVHSLHPSPLPFSLLCVFVLTGTTATKVHHAKKATLTLSSSGLSGEGPRTHIQVLANSGIASILVLLHVFKHGYHFSTTASPSRIINSPYCIGFGNDILLAGVVANYAAVAADTLSSELGILAHSQPRLITTLQTVPRGTNGGVTLEGLLAGALGSSIIAAITVLLGPFCTAMHQGMLQVLVPWTSRDKLNFFLLTTFGGLLGSVLDSLLGALLQASVVDRRTGKVIEGSGGVKVLTSGRRSSSNASDSGLQQRNAGNGKEMTAEKHAESRMISSGRDILDNNQINILMAAIMSAAGMLLSSWLWLWEPTSRPYSLTR